MKLTDAKKELFSKIKNITKTRVTIAVKIYHCEEDLYNVELHYLRDGDYRDSWYLNEYEERKDALKRAKAVHKTVSGWFSYSDVTLTDNIEDYHV